MAERPLLFASPDLKCPDSWPGARFDLHKMYPTFHTWPERERTLAMIEFYAVMYFEEAIFGGTMDLERRDTLLTLGTINPVKEGAHPRLMDHFSQNAIYSLSRRDAEAKRLLGVCKTLSKVKNSCCPNAYISFDIPSFSFQLWTLRKVRQGEIPTISRVDMDKDHAARDKELGKLHCIECTCEACQDPQNSDRKRKLATDDPKLRTPKGIEEWCADSTLPDDYYSNPSLEKLRRMEEEKLEGSDVYLRTLVNLMQSYLALGDLEGAREARRKIIDVSHGFERKEETWSGQHELLKNFRGLGDLTELPIWQARLQKRTPPKPKAAFTVPTFMRCPHGMIVPRRV